MLRWISIVGGLLIMMGHHSRGEALFYYFRLEDQVPETKDVSRAMNRIKPCTQLGHSL